MQNIMLNRCGDCISSKLICSLQYVQTECILFLLELIKFDQFGTMYNPKLLNSLFYIIFIVHYFKKFTKAIYFICEETECKHLCQVLVIIPIIFYSYLLLRMKTNEF